MNCIKQEFVGGTRMAKIIIFDQVVKKYKDKVALNSISFSVEEGEIVGLVGRNGSGKTSILEHILGLRKPTVGKVIVDGGDPYYEKGIRKRIGFIMDREGVDPLLTAAENLTFFHAIYKEERPDITRVEKVLKKVELIDYKDKKVKTFSRGMKKRLEIAKLLLCKPDLIVLDEPFTGLDQKGIILLENILLTFKEQGKSMVISSHSINKIKEICHRLLILKAGDIIKII